MLSNCVGSSPVHSLLRPTAAACAERQAFDPPNVLNVRTCPRLLVRRADALAARGPLVGRQWSKASFPPGHEARRGAVANCGHGPLRRVLGPSLRRTRTPGTPPQVHRRTFSGATTAGDLFAPVAPVAWPVAPVLVEKHRARRQRQSACPRATDHLFDVANLLLQGLDRRAMEAASAAALPRKVGKLVLGFPKLHH